MIKACLFDLDGTLLDTLTTIAYFCNNALKKHGVEPVDDINKYKYFVGNGAKKLVERTLREKNAYNDDIYNKVYKYYTESYDADPTYLTEPYDGICPMLKALKTKGIKTGVISNKPDFATKAVCRKKLAPGLVGEVRGQVEGIAVKPDIQGPLKVLEALNVRPEDTMYIGDTSVDMQTGKNLGAYTVGVLWGFRSEEELRASGADEIVSHPSEIIEIIERINGK